MAILVNSCFMTAIKFSLKCLREFRSSYKINFYLAFYKHTGISRHSRKGKFFHQRRNMLRRRHHHIRLSQLVKLLRYHPTQNSDVALWKRSKFHCFRCSTKRSSSKHSFFVFVRLSSIPTTNSYKVTYMTFDN